jgi:DNA repair protein RadC
MALDIELTDEERSYPIDSAKDIGTIMKAILQREIKVRVMPPLKYKQEKFKGIYTDENSLRSVMTTSNGLTDGGLEYFWAIGLRNDLRLAFIDLVAIGENLATKIGSTEVFRGFGYYNATKAVIVRTNPDTSLEFSPADIELTKTLIRTSWVLGRTLSDHIIMNSNFEVASLLEAKQMTSLYQSASFEEMSANKVAAEAMQEITRRDRLIRKQEDELDKKARIINIQSSENKELYEEKKEHIKQIGKLETENAIKDNVMKTKDDKIAKLEEELARLKK